uniref:Cytosolic fatty-acid binding proteins domain-containing protein n=1 Tax=Ascaris lumbricoides TaxID=6252 RepID=A0A9J2Q966_ASCLU
MSEAFIGEWDLESSENFPEYLADVGVSRVLRAMATAAKPTIHISIDVRHKIFHSRQKFPFKMLCYSLEGKWTIKTVTPIRTLVLEFKLGEEFDDCTPDGRKMISIVEKIDDRRLEQTQKPTNDKDVGSLITRYIDDEGHFVVELRALKEGARTARRVHRKRQRSNR